MSQSPDAASVITEIEQAFANMPIPDDDNICNDNSGYHLECNQIAADFRGKHWSEVPLDVLRYHSSALCFFTPDAYRFYLPAYIVAVLLDYEEADIITDSVVYSLAAPPPNATYARIARDRVAGLTSIQRQAIKSFLRFLKSQYPLDDPLGDVDKALQNLASDGRGKGDILLN